MTRPMSEETRPKLSKRKLYQMALRHAIDERESLAEAYTPPAWSAPLADPVSIKVRDDALWQASEFRRLLREDYGLV